MPAGLRLTLQLFVATRVFIVGFGVATAKLIGHYSSELTHVIPGSAGLSGNSWLDSLAHWDSGWYMHIIQHGYTGVPSPEGQVDIAFFPFFPYLVRILSWPFGYATKVALFIGLLLTGVALIAGGYCLYQLVERKFNQNAARWGLICLFLSPMAFVLSAFMTEGVFICLLCAALLWADQRRWGRVAAVAALLPLTRPVGAIVVVVLVAIYAGQHGWSLKRMRRKASAWIIAPVAGLCAVLAINYVVTRDPLGFLHAEAGWGRALFMLSGPSGGLETLQGFYLFLYAAVAVSIVTIFRRLIGWSYWFLAVALVVVPLSSGLYGLIRYTAVIIPIYIILGVIAARYPRLQLPLTVSLAAVQAVHLVWWSLGMPIMQ